MSTSPGAGRMLSMDTLVGLGRGAHLAHPPRPLPLPAGMAAPLGCDAVAVPARLSPTLMPRLPRIGCVYSDTVHWWWLVPTESDHALDWPEPAHYARGALAPAAPRLIHRPDGTLPYTPPIPLYLALCRLTGATPAWSSPVSA